MGKGGSKGITGKVGSEEPAFLNPSDLAYAWLPLLDKGGGGGIPPTSLALGHLPFTREAGVESALSSFDKGGFDRRFWEKLIFGIGFSGKTVENLTKTQDRRKSGGGKKTGRQEEKSVIG